MGQIFMIPLYIKFLQKWFYLFFAFNIPFCKDNLVALSSKQIIHNTGKYWSMTNCTYLLYAKIAANNGCIFYILPAIEVMCQICTKLKMHFCACQFAYLAKHIYWRLPV